MFKNINIKNRKYYVNAEFTPIDQFNIMMADCCTFMQGFWLTCFKDSCEPIGHLFSVVCLPVYRLFTIVMLISLSIIANNRKL